MNNISVRKHVVDTVVVNKSMCSCQNVIMPPLPVFNDVMLPNNFELKGLFLEDDFIPYFNTLYICFFNSLVVKLYW